MDLAELLKRASLAGAYRFLEKEPEQNLPRLLDWLGHLNQTGWLTQRAPLLRKELRDPESGWYRLARSVWDDVDGEVRKTLLTNVVVNGAIQLPPAVDWLQANPQSFERWDAAVQAGKSRNTYFYVLPEIDRKAEEVIALCNEHADCMFVLLLTPEQVGTELADELLRVHNCIPAVEGGETSPSNALAILRSRRLLFGVWSFCKEGETLLFAEPYWEQTVTSGAKFALFCEESELLSKDGQEFQAELRQKEVKNFKNQVLLALILRPDFAPSGKNDEKNRKNQTNP